MSADANNCDLQNVGSRLLIPSYKSHQDHQGLQREQLRTLVTF